MDVAKDRKRAGWSIWLLWMVATSVGTILGIAGVLAAVTILGPYLGETPGDDFLPGGLVSALISLLVLPGSIGLVQWLVLRRELSEVGMWVPATVAGFVLGLIVAVGVGSALPPSGGMGRDTTPGQAINFVTLAALMGAGLGLPFGMAQGLVLRRHVSQFAWWVPAAVSGWALAMASYAASFVTADTRLLGGTVETALNLIFVAGIVAALGATSGAALMWLLRDRRVQPS